MKALYAMRYAGTSGDGAGALYLGDGFLLGADIGGLVYKGNYVEDGGRIRGQATMSAPPGRTGTLVTGDELPSGQSIPLQVDWPANFDDGRPRVISVGGRSVNVVFEKIGDIP